MMPGFFETALNDDDDYNPVVSLKQPLPVRELIGNRETEFEVRPNEDDGSDSNAVESCFDFEELEKMINLDMIDVDQSEGADDESPFDKYHRRMHNLREDGKLKKYIVKQGVGPLVPENCVVYIRYRAYLEYSEVPFDSTVMQSNGGNFPIAINLGKGQLLLGLHEALLSMRKGEQAEVLVHPDLAYGPMGCLPRIPPEATVLFIVEVDRFVDCGDIHNANDDLSMEERSQFCNVRKIATGHYKLANDQFSKENYSAAGNKYRQVINMLHNARLANEEEENDRDKFLIKNYTNACVCYHKLKNYKKVCVMAADAMRVNEEKAHQSAKLLYFWGLAKMMLADYNGAKKHLMDSKKLKPFDKEIAKALVDLEKKKNDAVQQEKIMMRKAFSFGSSEVKISEVNEGEEQFRTNISEQLQEFKANPNKDSLTLKNRFTGDEEKICIQVAKDLGLYARVVEGNQRVIHIKKPNES